MALGQTGVSYGGVAEQRRVVPDESCTGGKTCLTGRSPFRTSSLVAVDVGAVGESTDTGNSWGVACCNSMITESNSCSGPVVELRMVYCFGSEIGMAIITFNFVTDIARSVEVLLMRTATSGHAGCTIGIDVAGTRSDLDT